MPTVTYAGGSVFIKFTTRDSTGLPTVLAGSPAISIYKDASTTESTAGVTLVVSFDSRVGLNHIAVDTSQDAAFYTNGSQFYAVLTAGTVGGISVVGEVVGEFSLAAPVTPSLNLSQALGAARALDAIADTALTVNDALHCAIAGTVGVKDASSGTSMIVKTPSTATVLRTYAITTALPPTTVPTKIS